LLGTVLDIYITPNSQHLFVAISRFRWEIDSVARNLEICAELAKSPTNVYLQSYKQTCSVVNEIPLDYNFFGQYASNCFPFTYCPQIEVATVDQLNDGLYLPRPHYYQPCPKGSFCQQGYKFAVRFFLMLQQKKIKKQNSVYIFY